RSHDGFKIGSRVVLDNALSWYGSWNYHQQRQRDLRDIERAFYTLDGKQQPEQYAGIIGKIDAARREKRSNAVYVEDEYFRVRCFQNCNIHLYFQRDDLLRQVNKLLAEYYGEVLGEGSDVFQDDPLSRPNLTPAKN